MTKSPKTFSPTRSRDKVLQTLYELELSGEDLKDVLKNHPSEKSNAFYKDILKGVLDNQENIDEVIIDLGAAKGQNDPVLIHANEAKIKSEKTSAA